MPWDTRKPWYGVSILRLMRSMAVDLVLALVATRRPPKIGSKAFENHEWFCI